MEHRFENLSALEFSRKVRELERAGEHVTAVEQDGWNYIVQTEQRIEVR